MLHREICTNYLRFYVIIWNLPVVVTTFEGRPTKLGPNTLHPDSDGTDAFVQASILDLYSPSRSQKILHHGAAADLAGLEAVIKEATTSGKFGIVFGADESPTRSRRLRTTRMRRCLMIQMSTRSTSA